ncbi:MAG: DUF4870 domain-containing protein [Acidobacteriota bacterium]|nr:DUF4870 domain-containing protein [Blastocatellia bacterium]MDW8412922.1 DUF4870 domain-containing protein [Acidobacteriota bacterium]
MSEQNRKTNSINAQTRRDISEQTGAVEAEQTLPYQQYHGHHQYGYYDPRSNVSPHEPGQNQYFQQPMDLGLRFEPRVAAALSYVAFIISGIAFLLIERKNRFVRFHAMQSVIFSAVWIVTTLGIGFLMMTVGMVAAIIGISLVLQMIGFVVNLVSVGFFVLWVVLIVKAYQGNKYKLPIIGDWAEKQLDRF